MTNLEYLVKSLTGERNETWKRAVYCLYCPCCDDMKQGICGGNMDMQNFDTCVACTQKWLDSESLPEPPEEMRE